jgi:hypothetical protein
MNTTGRESKRWRELLPFSVFGLAVTIAVAALLVQRGAFAPVAPRPAAGPEAPILIRSLDVDRPVMVYSGELLRRHVKLENLAEFPLRLKVVGTSCNCTSAVLTQETLAPRSTVDLEFEVDSSALGSDAFSVGATVLAESRPGENPDGRRVRQELPVRFEIKLDRPLGLNPSTFELGRMRRGGDPVRRKASLSVPSDVMFEQIEPAKGPEAGRFASIEISPDSSFQGDVRKFELEFVVDQNQAPEEAAQRQVVSVPIRIRRASEVRTVVVRGRGEITSEVVASPSLAYWGAKDRDASREVILSAPNDVRIHVKSVEAVPSGVEFQIRDNGSSSPSVRLFLNQNRKPPLAGRGTVKIEVEYGEGEIVERIVSVPVLIM